MLKEVKKILISQHSLIIYHPLFIRNMTFLKQKNFFNSKTSDFIFLSVFKAKHCWGKKCSNFNLFYRESSKMPSSRSLSETLERPIHLDPTQNSSAVTKATFLDVCVYFDGWLDFLFTKDQWFGLRHLAVLNVRTIIKSAKTSPI